MGKDPHVHQNDTRNDGNSETTALTEARRETTEREAALKAKIAKMKKRQSEMEEQIRQILFLQTNHSSMDENQEFGENGIVGGQETVNEEDEDEED